MKSVSNVPDFVRLKVAIKQALIEKGMSITDLANKIGRSRSWTSNVINGHFPTALTMDLVLVALDMKKKEDKRHGRKKAG